MIMADRLELTGPAFTSRAVSFMNLMRTPTFRRAFEEDPAGTAMREFQLKLPARTISASNELLATILKDRAFNKWAQEFQAQVEKRHPALTTAKTVGEMAKRARAATGSIQREFAEGVAAHLPPDLVSKLKVRRPWKGQIASEDDIAIVLLVFVAVLVVVVAPKMRDALLSRNTVRLLVNQLEILKTGPNG
jgi:hypothetical protein